MPTDLDVYAPERWVDDASFRPEVRDACRRLVEQGWTDALRALHPGERIYTFWKYYRNAFARDAGLRIDHFLLIPGLATRLIAAGVDREARGRNHASDHAPAWIELAELPKDHRAGRGVRGGEFDMTEADPFNLERFATAQAPVFKTVLAEFRAGRKRSHWMWFVFTSAGRSRTILDSPVLWHRLHR